MMHNIRSFIAGSNRLPFMDRPRLRIVARWLGVSIAALWCDARAADSASLPSLEGASIDELLDVRVTTVSREESTVGKSPAAVHVITQEDIRRSGATMIPELLRMVPGLAVARIDGNKWAVAARGFDTPRPRTEAQKSPRRFVPARAISRRRALTARGLWRWLRSRR